MFVGACTFQMLLALVFLVFRILQLYAEENAIDDTVYYLGEALRKGVIELEVYLKVCDIITGGGEGGGGEGREGRGGCAMLAADPIEQMLPT